MKVVQFMHPGDEVRVLGTTVEWNTSGRHFRRLLCHAGEYVDGNNYCNQNDNLCFWNEYEAPTQVHPILQSQRWNLAQYYQLRLSNLSHLLPIGVAIVMSMSWVNNE